MEHHVVTSSQDTYLPFVEQLYREAFPARERRHWSEVLTLIDKQEDMFVEVFTDGDQAIGFMVYWMFGEYCFIEYLAIDPAMRGLQYGGRVMERSIKKRVLLEVEPPVTPDAIRRIRFYERAGLHVLKVPYRQPSYNDSSVFYDMRLMSNLEEWPEEDLAWIRKQVLQRVYGIR